MGLLEEIKRRRDRAKLTKKKPSAKGNSARKFSKADLAKIAEMTDYNFHGEARAFIAKKMGYTKLCKAIEAAGLLRDAADIGGFGFTVTGPERHHIVEVGGKAQDAVMIRLRKEDPNVAKRVNESL